MKYDGEVTTIVATLPQMAAGQNEENRQNFLFISFAVSLPASLSYVRSDHVGQCWETPLGLLSGVGFIVFSTYFWRFLLFISSLHEFEWHCSFAFLSVSFGNIHFCKCIQEKGQGQQMLSRQEVRSEQQMLSRQKGIRFSRWINMRMSFRKLRTLTNPSAVGRERSCGRSRMLTGDCCGEILWEEGIGAWSSPGVRKQYFTDADVSLMLQYILSKLVRNLSSKRK